jgi:hypothetical protein
MTIDSVTAIQYTGYFHGEIRKILEQGKVAEETQEAIFQKKLEEEKKRIQPTYETKGKLVDIII